MPLQASTLPVVVLDDDRSLLLSIKTLLGDSGIHHVLTLEDSNDLLPLLETQEVGLILLDLIMPHISGLQLLPELVERFPEIPTIVLTAVDEVDTAVSSMKVGAFDYLVKPVEENRLISSVQQGLEVRRLRQELGSIKRHLLSDSLENPEAFIPIVAGNRKIRSIFQYIEAIARSSEPVLICGETGVGKELFSEAVHRLSGRTGQFVQINVAGLDDTLFSDTLFGHHKGAFTGALEARDGLIAQASEGTLLLDEIGDLKPASQVKLLRLLQEHSYYPLGSDLARTTDVRIICATSRELGKFIKKDRFRSDLYFRLSVHQIEIPPLRQRQDDIPLLVAHFIEKAAMDMHKPIPKAAPELFTLLANYEFPGNVRELRAMVYNAVAIHHRGTVLSMESFRAAIEKRHKMDSALFSGNTQKRSLAIHIADRFPTLKTAENFLIQEALRRANQNQGIAASLLGISRLALNRRLSRIGNPDEEQSSLRGVTSSD